MSDDKRLPLGVTPDGRLVFAEPASEPAVLWEWPAGSEVGGEKLSQAWRLVSHGSWSEFHRQADGGQWEEMGLWDDRGTAEDFAADLAQRLRAAGHNP